MIGVSSKSGLRFLRDFARFFLFHRVHRMVSRFKAVFHGSSERFTGESLIYRTPQGLTKVSFDPESRRVAPKELFGNNFPYRWHPATAVPRKSSGGRMPPIR